MKPKAPKKQQPAVNTVAVLAAWLAMVVATTSAGFEATEPIPFAYPAE